MKTVTIPLLAASHAEFGALPRNLEFRRAFLRHLLSEPLPPPVQAHLLSMPCFVRFLLDELDSDYWLDVWEPLQAADGWLDKLLDTNVLRTLRSETTLSALSRHHDDRVAAQASAPRVPRIAGTGIAGDGGAVPPIAGDGGAGAPVGDTGHEPSLPSLRKAAGHDSFLVRCTLLANPSQNIVFRFPQIGIPAKRWVLVPPDRARLTHAEPRQSVRKKHGRPRRTGTRLRPLVQLHSMRDFLNRISDKEGTFRGTIFRLPPDPGRSMGLYPHQQDSLQAIKEHLPAYNGVIHLPTGGGKTHIAMRFAADFLASRPYRKVLWASYPKQLIRQSMARIVELAAWFPPGTRIAWYDSWMVHEPHLLDQVDVLFVMRDQLGELMARATLSRPTDCPLRRALIAPIGDGGYETTLVYDECHQVAARKLRGKWLKLTRSLTAPFETARTRFHVVGLSATPVPQSKAGRRFVSKTVFPPRAGIAPGLTPEWGLLTYHQVSNRELVDCSVLCPINLHFQELPDRPFEIPSEIIQRVTAAEPIELPYQNRPSRVQIERFSSQFNRQVMSAPEVLEFLATSIGDRLHQLGKTLVFVPTIDAANELGRLLAAHPHVPHEDVLVVHSRLGDPELGDGGTETAPGNGDGGTERPDAPAVIEDFKSRGHNTCVLINVGMLTQGFDDPAIRSIILARLTFSTNLFWQMIGRGTRGPKTGGTRNCYVVDPIRLGDMYDFLEGYRPRVTVDGYGRWDRHFTSGAKLARAAVLAPQVPRVSVPPLLSEASGKAHLDLPPDAADLLRRFLAGDRLPEQDFVNLATTVEATQSGPDWYCASVPETASVPGTASVPATSALHMIRWMHEAVAQLEKRADCTLHWLRLPRWRQDRPADTNLRLFYQSISEIEDSRSFSEEDFEEFVVGRCD